MRLPRPAFVAPFSLLGLSVFLVASSHAQANGTTSSVTSQGFGGPHPITAPFPMGGTLPGHQVPKIGPGVTFSSSVPNSGHGDGHHHHHHNDVPLVYAYPVPYAVDLGSTEDASEDNSSAADDDRDANYQGGPTIFDRRGSGADSYIPPEESAHAHRSREANRSPADAVADQPAPEAAGEPTLLVFKDGHQLKVGNYAIVGATLFDLTTGHSRKVALADLDLDATQRVNDERGITFQIPQLPQAN